MAPTPEEEEGWELVPKPGEPAQSDLAGVPSSTPDIKAQAGATKAPTRKEPPPSLLEVLTAKLIYAVMCCLETAIVIKGAATQLTRRVGVAVAALAHKAEQALQPALAAASAAAAERWRQPAAHSLHDFSSWAAGRARSAAEHVRCAAAWAKQAGLAAWRGLWQRGRAAAARPAVARLRDRAAERRRRTVVAARKWGSAAADRIDPERKLKAALTGSPALPRPTLLLLAGGAGLLLTAGALAVAVPVA